MLSLASAAASAGVLALSARALSTRPARPVTPAPVAPTPLPPTVRLGPSRLRWVVAAIVALMMVGAASIPWSVPGFADRVGALVAPPRVAAIADPAVLSGPAPTGVPTRVRGQMAAAGAPVELAIPRLQVRAPVVPISGNSGALLPPEDPQSIGWWSEGSRPGDGEGAAVLTGHTVHTGGGAFDHLGSLKAGDRFSVRTARGEIRYRVTGVRAYTTGSLAKQARAIFRVTGSPLLLLVTCSDFNGTVYLTNTVVSAVPVV